MGLLKISDIMHRGDIPLDVREEIVQVRNEIQRVSKHNDSLVSQVNNLLHFINEQNRRKRELQQRITINSKTGLPNHTKMDQDLHSFFDSLSTIPDLPSVAVIIVKLGNNYDVINKTLKPSVSEWIIYQISSRLREVAQDGTPVFHTRDDEFLLIISDQGEGRELTPLVEQLYQQVSKPHIFSGYHISIDCNIGISVFPKDGKNKSDLLNNADIALNYAKKSNRRFVFYIDKMRKDVVQKMELQNSIIKALEEQSIKNIDQQFYTELQPIVTIKEMDGDIPIFERIDAEALIRWNSPERGIIRPDTFIPIAEETGLIIVIGKWILYSATAQIEKWRKGGVVDSTLSINVSPKQFNNDDLIKSIERIVAYHTLNPEKLQIEITENSFINDPNEAIRKIKRLKNLGIKIAIDDFGTGFSSVNYLRKLPVDVVKIDRSFISDITGSYQDQSIVKAMIAMTRELGMANVVEGVESIEQLRMLMNFGIEQFQGFFFAKSMLPERFNDYYSKNLKKIER